MEKENFNVKVSNKIIEILEKDIEIFKNMNFEEIDFYIFYVNYLSKKEYEDKKLDSFFNVRLEWLNKLLLVVKELYPNVSMINFYS